MEAKHMLRSNWTYVCLWQMEPLALVQQEPTRKSVHNCQNSSFTSGSGNSSEEVHSNMGAIWKAQAVEVQLEGFW